jgi:hypothetical protein
MPYNFSKLSLNTVPLINEFNINQSKTNVDKSQYLFDNAGIYCRV